MKQKIALVTGASSGIGAATARALAKDGMAVALAARRKEKLDELAAEITAVGGTALVLEADLVQEAEAQRVVRETVARFGALHVLVNNAGVMYNEPVASASLERWRYMLELNVLSLIASSQAALATMAAQKDGHIVNISSVAGRFAFPGSAAYAATKFGVRAFSESLRKEVLKDNVRVTVIEPGAVETELVDHIAHEGARAGFEAMIAGMRVLKSEDIARIIAFCVAQPDYVDVNEILIRPTDQER